MAGLPFDLPAGAWVPPDAMFAGAPPPVDPGVPPAGLATETGATPGAPSLAAGGDQVGVPPAPALGDWPPPGMFPPIAAADAVAGTPPPPAAAPAPSMVPADVAAAQAAPIPGQAPGFGVQLDPPGFPGALFPPQAPAQPFDLGGAPPEEADPDATGEASALVDDGREAVARHGAVLEQQQADLYNKGVLEDATRSRQTAEKTALRWRETEADLQKERVALRTEAAELAKRAVNDDAWWDSRTTGQKVANYVNAIVGGILSPYHGGQNSGLDLIKGAINQSIETQKFNINQQQQMLTARRSILSDLTAANNDMLRSEETLRLAASEAVINELKAKAAGLDPRGAAVQRIATAIQSARAEQKKIEAEADQKLFDRKKDIFDMQLRQETLAESQRSRRQQAAEAKERQAFGEKQLAAQMYREGYVPDPSSPTGFKPDPARPVGEDLDAQVKRANLALTGERTLKVRAERERQEATTRAEQSAAGGSPHAFHDERGQPFRQKDGRLFEVTDDTRKKDIDRLNESAQNVRRLAELMRLMKDSEGGASKWLGTPEYQEYVSLAQVLDFDTLKNFGLGAPTGRDIELVQNARGGKDITSFVYDATAGIETLANQVESKLNTKMKSVGYDGPQISFARYNQAPSTMTPEQGFDFLLASPAAGTPTEARKAFYKSQKQLVNRWAKDSPWVFEQMDVANIKAHWQDQVARAPEADRPALQKEIAEASTALDKAAAKAARTKALEPIQYDYAKRIAESKDDPRTEDEEDED